MPRTVQFIEATSLTGATQSDEVVTLKLTRHAWDDYGFRTTFDLWLDGPESPIRLGTVKIGVVGMNASFGGQTARTDLPAAPGLPFPGLPRSYFSLGQDGEYYEKLLYHLGPEDGRVVLARLHDLALEKERLDELAFEPVLDRSLLRAVKKRTILDEYERILDGGARREAFSLTYLHEPAQGVNSATTVFEVEPEKAVPGTLQVVIGSNGAGKTRMLRNIRSSLDPADGTTSTHVRVSDGTRLSGLVTVSFSAFDIFQPLPASQVSDSDFQVTHLGLSLLGAGGAGEQSRASQTHAFRDLVEACESAGRSERLMTAIRTLCEADRTLDENGLENIEALKSAPFGDMSSGHKIVLLTVTGLVKNCGDATLILLDEPESHLHPPLLAAFIRAVSNLVAATNSLAIVATHSPVVLQQVPRIHARRIWRRGSTTRILAMSIETLGENLGTLTREVFGVDLERSGHYALLAQAAEEAKAARAAENASTPPESDYEKALDLLGGSLGEEAKLILRALVRRNG